MKAEGEGYARGQPGTLSGGGLASSLENVISVPSPLAQDHPFPKRPRVANSSPQASPNLLTSSALSSSIAFLLMVKGVRERSFCAVRPGREAGGRCRSGCRVPRMGEASELHSQRRTNKNTRGTGPPGRRSARSPRSLLQRLEPRAACSGRHCCGHRVTRRRHGLPAAARVAPAGELGLQLAACPEPGVSSWRWQRGRGASSGSCCPSPPWSSVGNWATAEWTPRGWATPEPPRQSQR